MTELCERRHLGSGSAVRLEGEAWIAGAAGDKKAMDTMVSIRKPYRPVSQNMVGYKEFYREVYVKFYDAVQGFMHKIAEINDQFDR